MATPNPEREAALAELYNVTSKVTDRCLSFLTANFEKIGTSDCILGDFRRGISDWLMLIEVPNQGTAVPAHIKLGKGAKVIDFIFLLNDGGMEGQLFLHPQFKDGVVSKLTYDLVVAAPVLVNSPEFRAYLGVFSQVSDHPAHKVGP